MIAMFDSGLGGLSVWKAVQQALPNWPITYLADQAYCPYGERSVEDIAQRSVKLGQYLAEQGASVLVVACNTATAAAIAALREQLSLPLVGIEPAIKPAASLSRTGRIAVLATQATLNSQRMQSLQDSHAGQVTVLRSVGSGWVEQVEAGDLTSLTTQEYVARVITPLLSENIDHIALGCTHYPFLTPLIQKLTGPSITLYDPAEAIARRTQSLLNHLSCPDHHPYPYRFITTDADASKMAKLLPVLIGQAYAVEAIAL